MKKCGTTNAVIIQLHTSRTWHCNQVNVIAPFNVIQCHCTSHVGITDGLSYLHKVAPTCCPGAEKILGQILMGYRMISAFYLLNV